MRVTSKSAKTKHKRQDSSVRRSAKRGCMTQVARIRGPIWTHPSGLMKAARHLPHETLERQAKAGDRKFRRRFTWRMLVRASAYRFFLYQKARLSMPVLPAVPHRIKSGETLSGIAQCMLGSAKEWPRLYAFNNMDDVLARGGARIANPDIIRAGDIIYLPVIGPKRSTSPLPPQNKGQPSQLGRTLMQQVATSSVPFAIAHDIKRHLVTLDYGTYIARVSISCRFSLTKPNRVLLTQVLGKGFEFTAKNEVGNAYAQLISDTKIQFDPKLRTIGVSCGLITKANGVKGPKAVLGIAGFTALGMLVLRAEITCPELKGQIGTAAYVAVSVKFAVEIEPRAPRMSPVPVAVPILRPSIIPKGEFDWNELFKTPPLKPTVVVAVVVLGAALAIWVFLPLAVGVGTVQLAGYAALALAGLATTAN